MIRPLSAVLVCFVSSLQFILLCKDPLWHINQIPLSSMKCISLHYLADWQWVATSHGLGCINLQFAESPPNLVLVFNFKAKLFMRLKKGSRMRDVRYKELVMKVQIFFGNCHVLKMPFVISNIAWVMTLSRISSNPPE